MDSDLLVAMYIHKVLPIVSEVRLFLWTRREQSGVSIFVVVNQPRSGKRMRRAALAGFEVPDQENGRRALIGGRQASRSF